MFMGLIIQPCKCLAWSPLGFPFGFSPHFGFCYPLNGIRVLGVPFGFASFSFSFLQVVLNEDVRHVKTFLGLKNVHVAFGILS